MQPFHFDVIIVFTIPPLFIKTSMTILILSILRITLHCRLACLHPLKIQYSQLRSNRLTPSPPMTPSSLKIYQRMGGTLFLNKKNPQISKNINKNFITLNPLTIGGSVSCVRCGHLAASLPMDLASGACHPGWSLGQRDGVMSTFCRIYI